MTARPIIATGEGSDWTFRTAATPAQAIALMERVVTIAGGRVIARRPGGFDFAPEGRRRLTRGSLDLGVDHAGTWCEVRVGWPLPVSLRFGVAMLALAAVAIPASVAAGPTAFAGVLTAIAILTLGRYVAASWRAGVLLRRIRRTTRPLICSTVYRAPVAEPASIGAWRTSMRA